MLYSIDKKMTKKKTIDSGMALVLILLLIGYFTDNILFLKFAIPILIIDMIFPVVFYPFALFWFGMTHFLGSIISKIILSIIYYIILAPVGMIRRLWGKDVLMLRLFKKIENL